MRFLDLSTTLLIALMAVESGGRDGAVGDGGLAFGPLQIHAVTVAEVNRLTGSNFKHEDAFDREKAFYMAQVIFDHHVTPERLGRPVTDEDRAKCWNGGPSWFRKPAHVQERLERYWQKVKAWL